MINNEELLSIAKNYGTQTYIFDLESLTKRVLAMKKIADSKYKLCYSIKANPFLISKMVELVDNLEVCSPGELEICKKLKVPAEMIIYSGVNKTEIDIKDAMEYNVGLFTAESLKHVKLISDEAIAEGKVVPVILRLNAGSQFGMSQQDFEYVLGNTQSYKGIKVTGIHFFSGTQNRISKQQKEINKLIDFIIVCKEKYSLSFNHIEYGPGLSVSMFEKDDFSDTLKPLEDLHEDLLRLSECGSLTIEMGRFFATYCGTYLTSVMDTKENNGINYCIIDGGINHISYYGSMMGMNKPIIKCLTAEGSKTSDKKWCICGSLCSTNDVVVRQYDASDLKEGDVFAFFNIGAYSITEGIYLFLSRDMPKVLIRYEKDKYEIIRNAINSYKLNLPVNI